MGGIKMASGKTTAVILAGGRSSRMGVERKALAELAGRPLLDRVLERVRPQVGTVLLSCEAETADFDGYGLTLVPDLLPGRRGPLVGLYSALQFLADKRPGDSLLLCPCDAPFVPLNLVQTLVDAGSQAQAVLVAWRGVPQPTFSLWRAQHLDVIREALLEHGLGGPRQVLERLPHRVVEWPDAEPPPFFNINTPADLDSAAAWLDPNRV